MNLAVATTPKTFSLLSIGQRGVGKTVFLAGSYTELHPDNQSDAPQQLWFDCEDEEVQSNLEKIKNHVARTNLYPPPTIKITNFDFSLKRRLRSGVETVCNFRWWDIPGESCNVHNPDFQEMIFTSNGCCVFINAHALIEDKDYPSVLEDIYNQVAAIASVVYKYNIQYAFALILTKCDLIDLNLTTQSQIDQSLQPIITYLDLLKLTYQKFYSAIPIVATNGVSSLKAQGAASPLLWLLSHLNNPETPPQEDLPDELGKQSLISHILRPKNRNDILLIYSLSFILLAAIAGLFLAFHSFTSTPQQTPTTEQQSS
jgi:GTPase SAR1 family protein